MAHYETVIDLMNDRERLKQERDTLVKALVGIAEYCSGDDTTLGAIHRLVSIRNTAERALAAVGGVKNG